MVSSIKRFYRRLRFGEPIANMTSATTPAMSLRKGRMARF